jgi:hypothetical protein
VVLRLRDRGDRVPDGLPNVLRFPEYRRLVKLLTDIP